MRKKLRRSAGGTEVPIMLVIAVIVALVLLFIGVGALNDARNRAEGASSGFSVTESSAFYQMKTKCNLWSSSISSGFSGDTLSIGCEDDATVDSCIDVFLDKSFKAYSLMYYAKAARLDKSVYFSAGASTKTAACISAAESLRAGIFRENDAQATLIIGNELDKIYTGTATGGGVSRTGRERIIEIAGNCAALCDWINARSEECSKGSENCARLVSNFENLGTAEFLP